MHELTEDQMIQRKNGLDERGERRRAHLKTSRKSLKRLLGFESLEGRQLMANDLDDAINEAIPLGAISTTAKTSNNSISEDDDVDMFSFSVTSGQIIDLDIDTPLNGPGGLGSYIRLFNSVGTQLAFNNDGAAPGEVIGFDSYLRYTFTTGGTYYLGVSNYNNTGYNAVTGGGDTTGGLNATGSYQLTVVALPVDPDNTFAKANALGPISATAITKSASIDPDIDVDMYSFSATLGQVIDFNINTPRNGPGGLGSYIRLFNSTGTQIAFNNDGAAPGETLGFDAYLRYTFAASGTYYLGVSNFNNVTYDPITGSGLTSGGLHSIGTYALVVQEIPPPPIDTNDTIGEAVSLGTVSTTALTTSDTISPDVDVDMFSFRVAGGQVVDFNINTTLNGPGGLGSYIRLFDSSGLQLAFNNDAAAPGETLGFDAYLRYTFTSAGTYYLGVSNNTNIGYNAVTGENDTAGGSNSTGAYQLVIQALPVDPDNTLAKAKALGAVSTTANTSSASIDPDIDIDMYSFTVGAGQVVDFDIDTPLNGPGGLGSYIRLFNALGTELAFNNDGPAPGEALGFDSYLRFTFALAGTYYLGVTNFNNAAYNPVTGGGTIAGGLHSIGSYQLIIQAVLPTPIDTDDAISEAIALGVISTTPVTVNNSINPDVDVDMYSFVVTAGQVIDLNINTVLNGPGGLGSYIRLFNAAGTQLAFNNDAAAPGETLGYDAYLRYTFTTAGTYYLGVSNFNNIGYNPTTGDGDVAGGANSIGTYALVVLALPVDPDNTIAKAKSLGAVTSTANTTSASINPDIDIDMYSFTVTAGQVVDLNINTTLNGPGGLGSYIRLFNSGGTQLAFNNDAAAPGEVLGYDAYLRYTFTTAGTYYLGVSNFTNIGYDPITGTGTIAGGPASIGDYQFVIQAVVAAPTDTNDSISEAIALGAITTTATTTNETISPDVDVDMYSFTVTAGQVVDFNINTVLNGPGGLGSYIRLFNASGTQLAFNNDGAAPGEVLGFDSYLRYTFTVAGKYYLGVSNYNNIGYDPVTGDGDTGGGPNSTGAFQLVVMALPVDPDNTFSKANALGAVTETANVSSASITPDVDVDMYSFTVTTGQVVDFNINTAQNGTGGLGSYIRLFSASGAQLAFNNNGAAPGETLGFDAYLRYTFTTAGTYHLGVSNSNNITYDPITGTGNTAGGADSIGAYDLVVQAIVATSGDTNDAISEATSLGAISTTAVTSNETISPDIDVDMYGFTVVAGQTVDFNINTPLNGPGGLGSYIRLFNSTGTQLAFNNDGAAPGETLGFDSYLRYTFTSGGSYYLGVSNSNNIAYDPVTGNGDTAGGLNATGTYQLLIQALAVDADNTIAKATALGAVSTTAITTSATIDPDIDIDMYGFTVTAGQSISFNINTPTNAPGGLGSYLRLFNASGIQFATNDNGAAPGETLGLDSYLEFTFPAAGTYYLGVSNSNNTTYSPTTGVGTSAGGMNATGNYQLVIQAAAAPVSDTNDSISEAIALGAITTSPLSTNDSISPDTDVDMYSFTVLAGQRVDFNINTPLNGPGGLGSYIRVFNSSGTQLAFNDDGTAPGESAGIDSYLRFLFTTAGTYYIGVSNSTNINYNPTTGDGDLAGGLNSTGSYQLTLQALPDDPDDTLSAATALGAITASPIASSGSIDPDIDVDIYSFSVTAGQVVDFNINTPLNGPGGLGSYIRLFNASGTQLAFNNDAAAPGETLGSDSYLRFTFVTAGTYFIAVSNSNNTAYDPTTGDGDSAGGLNSVGSYQLVVQGIVSSVEDLNDTVSEAISLGAVSTTALSTNETISPDTDVDMFSFTVIAGQTVDFNMNTPLNGPGSLGSYIRLFNSSGAQLAANNDGAAPGETLGTDSYLRFTFPIAGTFYLGVSNSNNIGYDAIAGTGDTSGGSNSVGSYQLIVQALPVDLDNTIGRANPLGSVSTTATSVSAAIDPDVDVDVYSLTVSAGQVVDFNINTALNGPGGLGSYIRLFSSTGTQLAFNNDAAAPGEALGFDSYIRYTFNAAGTYYLGVSNSNNVTYDPLTGSGTTAGGLHSIGSYQLVVQAIAPTVSDSNDTISEAITLGSISSTAKSINETISPDVDVDMYSFSVTAGQVVDFNINTPLNGPGGLGSYIRLFNSTGSELASNNDAAAPGETLGIDSYLRFTFANGGTYFLGVSNSNNIVYNPITGDGDASGGANAVGSYQIIVQAIEEAIIDTNDAISEATSLGAVTTTLISRNDAIFPETDVDMFSFSAVAGQVVDVNINTVLNGPGGLGSYIRLFDSSGVQLALNDNGAAPGESLGYDSYLRFVFANTGTYFLGVSNDRNTNYDPVTGDGDSVGSINPTGAYTLTIQTISIGTPTLTLAISPSSISELNGVAVGTVRRSNADMSSALTVVLVSSSPADATVPASIVIPANQDSFEFQILAVHNLLRGTTQVNISATAVGYVAADQAVVVLEGDKVWHNFVQPTDVNNDQSVTALDALIIIDHLNKNLPGPVPSIGSPPPYLDVNGDNQVTPVDVLLVISKLSFPGNGAGEGESVTSGLTKSSANLGPAIDRSTAVDQAFADFDASFSQDSQFGRRTNRNRRFVAS